jgi:hypothetical protein
VIDQGWASSIFNHLTYRAGAFTVSHKEMGGRQIFELRHRKKAKEDQLRVNKNIILRIWGLDLSSPSAAAYIDHYRNLLLSRDLFDGENLALRRWESADVINLINLVKERQHSPLGAIELAFQTANPNLLFNPPGFDRDIACQHALDFAVRLWLFTTIDFEDLNLRLSEAVQRSLPDGRRKAKPSLEVLSEDLSAKSLRRKAGIRMVWTSSFPEHLTFVTKDRLRIFRHASVLRQYSISEEK